jgi:hypothetical protein
MPKPADRLRAAVAAGAHREAELLLEAFRRDTEQRWHAAQSDQDRRAIADEVTELLGWARTTAVVARAHTQGKLIQFSQRRAYVTPAGQPADRLEFKV